MLNSTTNANIQDVALTKPSVQINDLWRICFPLMLSALSGTFMIFLDRIVLAKYETQSMVAATTAANVFFIFQNGAFYIAMIAEIFVGQFNGAKQWKNVGKPVWQMIWFSLMCGIVMILIGLFGASWFIPAEYANEGIPYFKWMMLFGISSPLVAALCAFFIGRGKVKVVTLSVILGNLLNLVLVLTLVFGISGLIEPMGAKGAAIASGIAQSSVAVGLFLIFMNRKNRDTYHTHHWKFDKTLFFKCIKIGAPNAVGHMVATTAWAMVMYLLVKKSADHITVMSIGMSIWMLFAFITEGLQQGVTAIASNCMGAKKSEQVSTILMAGLQLQFVLVLILAIPLVVFPGVLVGFFIPVNESTTDISHLRELVEMSCRWLWLAYLFDGMAWVIDGILTAAGDTSFIMLMNSIGTWIFCICPIYLFVVKMNGTPIMTLQLIAVFCLILFTCYYLRYKSQKWQGNALISH